MYCLNIQTKGVKKVVEEREGGGLSRFRRESKMLKSLLMGDEKGSKGELRSIS